MHTLSPGVVCRHLTHLHFYLKFSQRTMEYSRKQLVMTTRVNTRVLHGEKKFNKINTLYWMS